MDNHMKTLKLKPFKALLAKMYPAMPEKKRIEYVVSQMYSPATLQKNMFRYVAKIADKEAIHYNITPQTAAKVEKLITDYASLCNVDINLKDYMDYLSDTPKTQAIIQAEKVAEASAQISTLSSVLIKNAGIAEAKLNAQIEILNKILDIEIRQLQVLNSLYGVWRDKPKETKP